MMMMMMMMMMSRYGTDKLIQLVMEHSPAVYHYILYFQDRFSFALNPGTLGMMIIYQPTHHISFIISHYDTTNYGSNFF